MQTYLSFWLRIANSADDDELAKSFAQQAFDPFTLMTTIYSTKSASSIQLFHDSTSSNDPTVVANRLCKLHPGYYL